MACRLIMSYFLGFEKTRWFWGTSILDIDCLVENGPWKTAVAIFKHAIDFPNWKQNSKHLPATLAKFKIQLLYRLESRWRNSHVLVHHCPLLSHLSCTIHFHYSVSVFQAEWQSSKTSQDSLDEITTWADSPGQQEWFGLAMDHCPTCKLLLHPAKARKRLQLHSDQGVE